MKQKPLWRYKQLNIPREIDRFLICAAQGSEPSMVEDLLFILALSTTFAFSFYNSNKGVSIQQKHVLNYL